MCGASRCGPLRRRLCYALGVRLRLLLGLMISAVACTAAPRVGGSELADTPIADSASAADAAKANDLGPSDLAASVQDVANAPDEVTPLEVSDTQDAQLCPCQSHADCPATACAEAVCAACACTLAPRPDGATCDDGDPCTTLDACMAAACVGKPDPCLDGDPCTADTCVGGCVHTPIPGCGAVYNPCKPSPSAGTLDATLAACVCGKLPECCTVVWSFACAELAKTACGADCDCAKAPAKKLSCTTSIDCAWCEDPNLCDGTWTCATGTCVPVPPVDCSTTFTSGCQSLACAPASGACVLQAVPASCDDHDGCTADACEVATGACTHATVAGCGTQHPCKPSKLAKSKDPVVTSCVCALEPACCESAWSAACVTLATTSCALDCECTTLPPEDLACTDAAECTFCDDGNACNGVWSCPSGQCAKSGTVFCFDGFDKPCLKNRCDPLDGACKLTPEPAACNDGDPCTKDLCVEPAWQCSNTPFAVCNAQHPCLTSDGPGSSQTTVTTCVCAADPFCCNVVWDKACVALAQSACGVACNCSKAPPTCVVDSDCGYCDPDHDRCNGSWTCVEGLCSALPPVTCDATLAVGCNTTTCDPATGSCPITPDPSLCPDDGDPCTHGFCDGATGACQTVKQPNACGTHPCVASLDPGSTSPSINACVCAKDPFCCTTSWDPGCVDAAIVCGATCDCAVLEPISCTSGNDCAFCSAANACEGVWLCVEGHCVVGTPMVCDPSGDIGCKQAKCEPTTLLCLPTPNNAACDDQNPCTEDLCDFVSGKCDHLPLSGCGG